MSADPPEIAIEHEFVPTSPGQKSEMTCIVHAHPHAKVTWFKGDKEVKHIKHVPNKDDKTRRTIMISHTTVEDLGTYHCKAVNELGSAISGNIRLSAAPTKPVFEVGEVDGTIITLKWKVDSHSPIKEYEVIRFSKHSLLLPHLLYKLIKMNVYICLFTFPI